MKRLTSLVLALILVLALVPAALPLAAAADGGSDLNWVGTWAAAQYYGDTKASDGGVKQAGAAAETLPKATLRQMIRTSMGGQQLRLTFSNEYGAEPMTINAVSVAKANGNNNTSNIDVSTNTTVTFNDGSASVTLQPGALATSDPIDFPVSALERIAVSIYFGDMPVRVSSHIAARGNSYIQPDTNAVLNETLSGATNTHWFVLCGADVLAPSENKSIVLLGDSITDGYGTSGEQYTRWADALMNNLQGNPDTSHLSVINMGIGTNALLNGTNPLAAKLRFERDVLNQPGVGYAVFQIGVNDLPGGNQTAANMIAAYEEMFAAAAAKGIKVFAGTVSPRGSSAEQDANRQTVNNWMRKQFAVGNIYGLVDFDALLRDPASPNNLLKTYANDGIHPNLAGYKLMGDHMYSLILEDIFTPRLSTAASWAREGIQDAFAEGLVPAELQDDSYTTVITRAEYCALTVAVYEKITGAEITERKSFPDDGGDINIQKLYGLDIVSGSDGVFNPTGEFSRSEVAAMTVKLLESLDKPLPAGDSTFADNASIASWTLAFVGQVQKAGLMNGIENNNFGPEVKYDRQSAIVLSLVLYSRYK